MENEPMSPVWIRRAFILSVIAAIAWAVVSLTSVIEREAKDYIDVMVLAPFALTGIAFMSLHVLQRDALNQTRLGRVSFAVSAAAMASLLVSQSTIAAGSDRLLWLGFPVGALFWLVGFALYGYATAKAGVLPAKIGIGLAIAEPLTIALGIALSPIVPLADSGSFSGAIGHSAVWLGIAWLLHGLSVRPQPEHSLAAG
jgi:hypothetical protein